MELLSTFPVVSWTKQTDLWFVRRAGISHNAQGRVRLPVFHHASRNASSACHGGFGRLVQRLLTPLARERVNFLPEERLDQPYSLDSGCFDWHVAVGSPRVPLLHPPPRRCRRIVLLRSGVAVGIQTGVANIKVENPRGCGFMLEDVTFQKEKILETEKLTQDAGRNFAESRPTTWACPHGGTQVSCRGHPRRRESMHVTSGCATNMPNMQYPA